ncbi:MAG: AMP-binding protein [Bacteroidales bacterium]|nr:AMP-binding protein [Bacteroidales bacterium]
MQQNFISLIEESIKKNWNIVAFTDYQGDSYKYKEVADKISNLHVIFEELNINKGDKIALIGRNCGNWAIVFLATITYGAVIVPILNDFHIDTVHQIINHSDSKLVFAAESTEGLDINKIPAIQVIFNLKDFSVKAKNKKFENFTIPEEKIDHAKILKYKGTLSQENIEFEKFSNNELALISYTSGTTGNSKGVMLSFNSLVANVLFAQDNMPLKASEKIVSFLPLAHSYGCAFEFLFPFTLGCHITFITKAISPQVLLAAFKEVKPHLILTVPLIIEKIYKKQLQPKIKKFPINVLLKTPVLNKVILKSIKKKLYEVFGGNFYELVIGGAALNKEVELFFKKMKFPFSIGYGMTECGPLISYSPWDITKFTSAGKIINYLEIKIDSEDPYNIDGEIMVKGENVMNGYYKNEKATKEVIEEDGWLHTGDLGVIDKDNMIFIRGRSKNMLLGPSGQNIYPEEIEAKINTIPVIMESVVIQEGDKLVALIYPDDDVLKSEHIDSLENKLKEIRDEINKDLPKYMQISEIRIHDEEFVKTPKKNIKRFLYQPKK